MTTPKTPTPEQLAAEIFGSLFGAAKPKAEGTTPVDNVAEVNRLLKKAEEVAVNNSDEAFVLLQVADRHLRLIDTALAYQK